MNLINYLKLYLSVFALFLAIDMVWLGVVAGWFYRKHLGYLLSPDVKWSAAILFYLLFIAGLLVFAILPGLQAGSARRAVALGAFFGLVTYATYDLTNHATIKDWPLIVTIVDLMWGAVLSAILSYLGFRIGTWLG